MVYYHVCDNIFFKYMYKNSNKSPPAQFKTLFFPRLRFSLKFTPHFGKNTVLDTTGVHGF